MDSDAATADMLYQRVQGARSNVLPLVLDITNPSPNQGWAEGERQGLEARGKADFVLCLALLHHVRFTANVPVQRFVSWLAAITRAGILEFVPKGDPMARRLLAWREDTYDDYDEALVTRALQERFTVTRVQELPGSRRTLYAFGHCE